MSLLAALLLAQATPEAVRLGEELASYGTLSVIGPLITAKETEELVAAHPELSAEEKDRLRATARKVAADLRARAIRAEGAAFAQALSVTDLKALVRFARSDVARRQRAAMPAIVAGTMQRLGAIDYKGSVLSAYCARYRKLCNR